MKDLFICCAFVLSLVLIRPLAFAMQVCGDIYPPESVSLTENCGDDMIDLLDLVTEVEFAMGETSPDDCQASRADVPTGTPPNCLAPDGKIDTLDIMVIIDMLSNRQNCCDYYYSNTLDCTIDEDCYDDLWCTGKERCINNHCIDGILPCDDGNGCSMDSCREADHQGEDSSGICSNECFQKI